VTKNEARAAAELIPVTERWGVSPQDFAQMVDMAKWMALDHVFTPPHLRGSQAACITLHQLAAGWGLLPSFVASMTFVVKGRIGYESQLWNAVLERSNALEGVLEYEFGGEGDGRYVIVRGKLRRANKVLEYQSPPLSQLKPARNADGELKGSPLWDKDPDQQLSYYGSRAWMRRHASGVMPGIYGRDELEEAHIGPEWARDVTPRNRSAEGEELRQRLEAAQANAAAEQGDEPREGYQPNVVEQALRDSLLATPIMEFAAWSEPTATALLKRPIATVGDLTQYETFKSSPRVLAEIKLRLSEKGLTLKRKSPMRRSRPRPKR
jgi:hypothetical protein